MLRRVKILHRAPKETAIKTFYLFPLFHCGIPMILFTRPLRCLCLPILVHNLCCCFSGKRKVHNDVHPSLKVCLNSNSSVKVWPLVKIWERRIRFLPVHATQTKDTLPTSPCNPKENSKKGGGNEWGILPSDVGSFKNFLEGAPKNRCLLSNVDHVFTLFE